MRNKDEFLAECGQDITNERYKQDAHLWLEVRKIEVLIDIRDHLEGIFAAINAIKHTPQGGY